MQRWTIHLEGGPRRVNHAAVAIGEHIFSFSGYCTGEDYETTRPMDVHILNTGLFDMFDNPIKIMIALNHRRIAYMYTYWLLEAIYSFVHLPVCLYLSLFSGQLREVLRENNMCLRIKTIQKLVETNEEYSALNEEFQSQNAELNNTLEDIRILNEQLNGNI